MYTVRRYYAVISILALISLNADIMLQLLYMFSSLLLNIDSGARRRELGSIDHSIDHNYKTIYLSLYINHKIIYN